MCFGNLTQKNGETFNNNGFLQKHNHRNNQNLVKHHSKKLHLSRCLPVLCVRFWFCANTFFRGLISPRVSWSVNKDLAMFPTNLTDLDTRWKLRELRVVWSFFLFFSVAIPRVLFYLGIEEKYFQPSSAFLPLYRDFYRLFIATSIDTGCQEYFFLILQGES